MSEKVSKQERRLEKELLWIVGFFAILIVLFLVASSIFKSFNRFEYGGLLFTKEKFGEIPVFHHYYSFKFEEKLFRYNLFLRTDPRENNVSFVGGPVKLDSRLVFVTINATGLNECPRSTMAIATLSSFLSDNQFLVKGGNMNFNESLTDNQEYVTCQNRQNNDVIKIIKGNETIVSGENNCYTIEVGPDCRILEAVEKFEVQAVLDRPV